VRAAEVDVEPVDGEERPGRRVHSASPRYAD
jgi:hypothetical protein